MERITTVMLLAWIITWLIKGTPDLVFANRASEWNGWALSLAIIVVVELLWSSRD